MREYTDEQIREGGLLLHCCCGPCAEYPLHDLEERGIPAEALYANPNIHPVEEWQKRLESMQKLAELRGLSLRVENSFDENAWRELGESGSRCMFCYRIRMGECARIAKEMGKAFFTTTLLVSPYQNRELILKNGYEAAEKYGITFLPEDWREHFREGQDMAKEHGLYRQKYCGCCISLEKSDFLAKINKQHAAFVPQEGTPKSEELHPVCKE